MKIERYPLKTIEKDGGALEQTPDVPIIDFIRHAETEYKQGEYKKDRDIPYKRELLNTTAPDFALDSEHLDITSEGISTMQETGRTLLGMIDKEKEVILIVGSPAQRTHSSALVVEKILRDSGINILNEEGNFKFFESINETLSRMAEIEESGDKKTSEGASIIENKRREIEAILFQKFLRHMNNIYNYLQPETLEKLKGKKLRILCFTHSEMTRNFVREAFNLQLGEKAQGRSQILEITPEAQLRKNDSVVTDAKLHSTKKHPGRETKIERGFELDK